MKEYLPIGSICLLKNGRKKVMVIGYAPQSKETNKIFDYLACVYPEGLLAADKNISFDNDQIDKVLYEGLKDEEQQEFSKKITNYFDNIKK